MAGYGPRFATGRILPAEESTEMETRSAKTRNYAIAAAATAVALLAVRILLLMLSFGRGGLD